MAVSYSTKTSGLSATDIFVLPLAGGYSNEANLALLAASIPANEGELGVYENATNTLVTAALTAGQQFRIYQKVNANVFPSAVFTHTPTEKNYAYCTDFVASVNQVDTVTITASATAIGQRFAIRLFDTTEGSQPYSVEEYEFISVTGAETPTQIAAGIVANYVAKKNQSILYSRGLLTVYTVSSVAAIITITTTNIRTIFTTVFTAIIAGIESNIGATIAKATPYKAGTATAADLKQIEFEGQNFDGYVDRLQVNKFEYWGSLTQFIKTSCSYDFIYLNPNYVNSGGLNRPAQEETLLRKVLIVIETATPGTSGSPAYTALKTIFGL